MVLKVQTVKMDTNTVSQSGPLIKSYAADYQKEINNIKQIITDLSLGWSGEAASRHISNINKFIPEFAKFGTVFDSFGDTLITISNNFKKLEKDM